MIWTKRTRQSEKFQTFDCSREISSNFYFIRLLLLKVYKISAKKYIRFTSHDTKIDAKFEEKLIFCFKNDKHLVNCDLSTGNSQNFYFDWFLICKVYND